jgi:hypothetical protein
MGLTDTREGRSAAGIAAPGRPLVVWCLLRDQRAHVEPVERHFGAAAEFVYDADWKPDAMLRRQPDIVLCVNDYPYEIARCLDAARANGIPSLVLQDGILEWRCQYENPLFGAGGGAPQHQPVLADRIACLGHQSARQIAAWGNEGKTVATGMPRLDYLLGGSYPPRRFPGSRVLVMTAKNPGFTPAQRDVTLRSLRDVRAFLEQRSELRVTWRLPRAIAEALGVQTNLRDTASEELVDQVAAVDAVITTPSTAMLEAMLLDRPVAALDYHNVPRFVATAWTISAQEQIGSVAADILAPPASRMAFQRNCLDDCLRTDGPAAPRVAALMRDLAAGRGAGLQNSEPPGSSRGALDLGALYPGQSAFTETDLRSLQIRVARAEKTVERLQLEKRRGGIRHGVYALGRELVRVLRSRSKGVV